MRLLSPPQQNPCFAEYRPRPSRSKVGWGNKGRDTQPTEGAVKSSRQTEHAADKEGKKMKQDAKEKAHVIKTHLISPACVAISM